MIRRIDIRKPFHAAMVGLVLAGILAPVADWAATNERYRMGETVKAVAERPSMKLESKLRYDKDKKANVFNAEGQADTKAGMKDKLAASVGAGGKKDTQLYTATMPDDPARGIDIHDNVNDVSVKFVPQMGLMDGRAKLGQVVYPLKGQAGQMIFTPKGNGVKEDIVLMSAPQDDVMDFGYHLGLPKSVQARLEDDGSVGFYTATPELFGNISYGSDKDRDMVDKARMNGEKNYLMFKIPAPVIRETGKHSKITGRFVLDGDMLNVHVAGLAKAYYPLSIDPTFLLQSTTDWVLGSIDDNIDLSVGGQVGRQALVGGSTPGWSAQHAPGNTGITTPNLTYAQFASALVAYNGFLYLIGGGSGSGASGTTTTDVRYISLDPATGALGTTAPTTWTNTGNGLLNTARQGLVAFGFNGYLYAIGGEDNAGAAITAASNHTVEYAKINSNGTVGTWAYAANQLTTARSYPAGAISQGVLYVMGGTSGTNNATPQSTIEYARIKGDGNVDTWHQSSSSATGTLSSARSKFRGSAYNGFLYVAGGQTSTTTVINTVEYAPIHSDGSVGAWVSTTAFPTARRDHGMMINSGYIYVFGGCTGAAQACAGFIKDTMYAVINADGTVGQWQSTLPYNSAINDTPTTPDYNNRMPAGVASYSNHLYFIGGCSAETATNNCATQLVGTFITNIDPVGRFDKGIQTLQTTAPFNNNASTQARYGGQAVALNGYLYYISGNNTTPVTAYSNIVETAPINANGTIGTFTTAGNTTLPAQGTNKTGRFGFTLAAYNNKVYVIGGIELNSTGTVDVFQDTILTGTQGAAGVLTGWTTETNHLASARAFHTTVQWHNYIYTVGGRDSTATPFSTILRSQIQSNGTLGTWSATTGTLSVGRWAHSGGIWGNYIYAIGGQSSAGAGGTYVVTGSGVERLTISSSTGDIGSNGTTSAFPVSQRYASGFVHNGYLYTFGGITSAATSATANIYWSRLDPSTGAPATFVNTNIGNLISGTAGLATARHQSTAVAVNGAMYILGGCTSASAIGAATYDDCSAFVSTAQATEVYLPNNGGTGQPNAFAAEPNALSAGLADHATVAYNGHLYKIGGCTGYTSGVCTSGSNSAAIEYAPIKPDTATSPGPLGGWTTSATSLPAGLSLLQAVAYNGYLYVIGGHTDATAAVATVSYINILNTGALGSTWSNADLPGGAERNAFGAAVMNGYIYVAGGDNGSGTKKSDVYYAQLSTVDGSLATSWATTTAFTTARSNLSLAAYNGRLYVVGGTDGTNTLTDVQFASQSNTGTIGSWTYTTDVPRGMNARQTVAANGYMYFFGDEGDGTEVSYVNINADGTLGLTQRSINVMAGAHVHGSASWFDGYFYVTGGCTLSGGACANGAPLTTSEYAGQQVISRVGHYSKLFDTQVDTAPTQLVINGAINGPGAAVEMKFQTASQADPVLGIAQLIRPVIFGNYYNVQALNSSGTNVGVAKLYLYLLTLDDSRSGTFPDVAYTGDTGFAQTSVSDITLYYHANPGRRLRHGASFTDTGCNPTPANGCILDTAP